MKTRARYHWQRSASAMTEKISARERHFVELVGARRLQARRNFGDGHRPAEAEALHGMDAGCAQEELLVGGFHTLGRDLHAKTAAEADDRMDDGRCVGRLFDRAHKAAVDLELVEGETAQIEQAGITRAEIIEREPDTERLKPQHRNLGGVDIA